MKKKIHSNNIIKHEKRTTYRLNKFISDSGLYSRREADRLIESNKVYVNGKLATLGMQVNPNEDIVKVNNKEIKINNKKVYILLNKPKGITCTTDLKIKDNIIDYMKYDETIFPVGRLDKDSTGLIILTNDGDIVNKILREEYGHEKEYLVTVDKKITKEFLNNLRNGVVILNYVKKSYEKTLPCKVYQVNDNQFRIILKQGLNRQIRRMTEKLNYKVIDLKRIRIMSITDSNLKIGDWRYLTNEELFDINEKIK
mgnify:CR=1 FL=1